MPGHILPEDELLRHIGIWAPPHVPADDRLSEETLRDITMIDKAYGDDVE